MFVITSNPEYDAGMYDIYQRSLAREDQDYSQYPVCDICGERIIPNQRYSEIVDDIYIHKDCMKYVSWRAMEYVRPI